MSPLSQKRPLTFQQLAAARLLLCGIGPLEVAKQLKIGRNTVARWRRDPRFSAELHRLTAMLDAATIRRLIPSIAAPVRDPLLDKPTIRPQLPIEFPDFGGKVPDFAEMAIYLGRKGIFPETNPKEFRQAMRDAGVYK